MAISIAYWRARRIPTAGAAGSSVARHEKTLTRRQERRYVRAELGGEAAAARDRFLDAIVLLSVAMFLLLAIGVGILVLRSALGS